MNTNLDFCLTLHRAHASLRSKLDDELGTFHGVGLDDFALLDALAGMEGGRAGHPQLAQALGSSASAVVRQLIALEKIGLVAREQPDGRREVVLRPAGRGLVHVARETARRVCDAAVPALEPSGLGAARAALSALAAAPAFAL